MWWVSRMSTRLHRMLLPSFSLFLGAALFAADDDLVLQFSRMDLNDGRKLKNVVVKSYDAKSEKLLMIADGKAMTVPITLLPVPFNEKLKGAPASGSTVNTVATPPRPIVPAANQYFVEQRVARPTPPPVVVYQPVPASAAPSAPMSEQIARAEQEKAARDRAQRYYTYEYPAGLTSHRVTLIDVELETPRAVPGWTGRNMVQGKAYVELYDRRNRSTQRTTSSFEVLLEQKPGESLKAVDFTVKN